MNNWIEWSSHAYAVDQMLPTESMLRLQYAQIWGLCKIKTDFFPLFDFKNFDELHF